MMYVLGLLALGVPVYRIVIYARSIHAQAKYLRDSTRFERQLRAWRESLGREAKYRVPTQADAEAVARLDACATQEAALVKAGFVRVGDSVPDGARSATRAFADDAHTTFAAITATAKRAALSLWSFAPGLVVVTGGSEVRSLAEPPSVRRQIKPGFTLRALIAHHRASCAELEPTVFATNDELIAKVNEVNRAVVAWRNEQSPDALLDADLRIALGDQYAKRGAFWAHKLRGQLPQARVVR